LAPFAVGDFSDWFVIVFLTGFDVTNGVFSLDFFLFFGDRFEELLLCELQKFLFSRSDIREGICDGHEKNEWWELLGTGKP